MLYEQWKHTAASGGDEVALRDLASGRRWTFAELFKEGESRRTDPDPVVCPQGHSPEFVFSLLSAWRAGKVVCPLEPGQVWPGMPGLPRDCLHLKWTSGTTDAPRLIAFTEDQLAADARQIVEVMRLRPDYPNLGVISLAHSYGFSNLVLPLLLHGVPLILAPAPLPEIILRAAAGETAITLAAVPALWRAWHDAACIPSQVRLAISAGAPLPLPLEESIFKTTGIKVHNFYGASECGGIAYDDDSQPRTDASFAGRAIPGVHVSVNGDGCLIVRSPAVGKTYWPCPAGSLGDGHFQSSDLAELKDGQVFLRGRASDQINVAGRKVSPETIERVLLSHPLVRECVVFGAPSGDSSRAEIIVAVLAAGAGEGELKKFLLDRLPAWQVPRVWRFVEVVGATPRGKISRAECRARFMA